MQIIEKLADMIEEEIGDAEKYAKCALAQKENNKTLADTFYTLSTEELKHMNMLHDQVVGIIGVYKKEHGDPPIGMKTLYDYLHRKWMDRVSEVKAMQATYKE